MSWPFELQLVTRIDEHSLQVSTPSDHRFWFRLVREPDRDVITDYFPGSLPLGYSGQLLIECYKVLGIKPRVPMVFQDVPSKTLPLYEAAAKALVAEYGIRATECRREEQRGKVSLTIIGAENATAQQ